MIDALVKVDNQYIHIELNSQNQAYLRNRNFSFFTGIYSKKTKAGEDYINLEDFIHIDLTYGLSKNLKEKEVYYMMNDRNKKYQSLIMLDLEEKGLTELSKISGGDKFMEEFKEKVEKINKETWFTPWISDEEDDRRILNTEKKLSFMEGEEKGKQQGGSYW